jgi:putative acetyltransferase
MTNRSLNGPPSVSDLVMRPEGNGDADAIRHVLVEAFGGEPEAELVRALRNNGALTLSFVACAPEEIVGHVAFSPMHAEGHPEREDILGLAPVAVHPRWQRRGIGSALIRLGLQECRRRGVAAVFVLGAPAFYARFGFIAAHARWFRCVHQAPPDALQVLLLGNASALPPAGLIRYRPEFDSFP